MTTNDMYLPKRGDLVKLQRGRDAEFDPDTRIVVFAQEPVEDHNHEPRAWVWVQMADEPGAGGDEGEIVPMHWCKPIPY